MRAILVSAILLAANAAHAGQLLGEFGINVVPFFQSLPADPTAIMYRFTAGGGVVGGFPTFGAEWQQRVTAADVGQVFHAPADVVMDAAETLAQADASIGVGFLGTQYGATIAHLYDPGWSTGGASGVMLHSQFFVPNIRDYRIDDVTMTVDAYHLEPFQGGARIGGGFTIRLYGVPEPASWLLVLVAGFIMAGTSARR